MQSQPEIPGTEVLRKEATELLNQSIVVKNNGQYEIAGRELVRVAGVRKRIVAAFKDPKEKAWEAHRAILKLENDLLRLPSEAERRLKGAMAEYRLVEERQRREAEAQAQADLKRQLEDQRIAEAENLAQAGHGAEAEALLEAPVVTPVVQMEKPQADGISTRSKWSFQITDSSAINRAFLIPDEKKIRQTVTAMGPDAEKLIGGIQVMRDVVVAVRT